MIRKGIRFAALSCLLVLLINNPAAADDEGICYSTLHEDGCFLLFETICEDPDSYCSTTVVTCSPPGAFNFQSYPCILDEWRTSCHDLDLPLCRLRDNSILAVGDDTSLNRLYKLTPG